MCLNAFTLILLITGKISIPVPTPEYKIEKAKITAENFGEILVPGRPILPATTVLVAIPPTSNIISLKIKAKKLSPVDTLLIHPFDGTNSESFYNLDTLYPIKAGKEIERFKFRNYNLVKIAVFPFSYNPKKKILYKREGITIEIEHTLQQEKPPLDTTLDNIMKDYIINFEHTRKWYTQKVNPESFDYLIIVRDALKSATDKFIAWKEALGYKVKIFRPDDIEYIKENYLKWGVKYIMVIGEPRNLLDNFFTSGIKDLEIGIIPYDDFFNIKNALENIMIFETGTGEWKRTILLVLDEQRKNFVKEISENINSEWRLETLNDPSWREVVKERNNGEYAIISIRKNFSIYESPQELDLKSSGNIYPSIVFSLYPLPLPIIPSISACSASEFGISQPIIDLCAESFNNFFLASVTNKKWSIGDALLQAKLDYVQFFPLRDMPSFYIYGDPSLKITDIFSFDVEVKTTMDEYFLPSQGEITPSCIIKNLGTQSVEELTVYCTIESSFAKGVSAPGRNVYSAFLSEELLLPNEERLIKFPEWKTKKGKYKISFRIFSLKDANPVNDTVSITFTGAEGDYILLDPKEEEIVLDTFLRRKGYNGVYTQNLSSLYPHLQNFASIFVTSFNNKEEVDSIISFLKKGKGLYLEGRSISDIAPSLGIEIKEAIFPVENIIGVSNTFTENFVFEYGDTIPFTLGEDNGTVIFRDVNQQSIGAYYKKDNYKVFAMVPMFKTIIGEEKNVLLDTIMHFLGIFSEVQTVGTDTDTLEKPMGSFYVFPNPFKDKTVISFEVKKEEKVKVIIYDLAGKTVSILLEKVFTPGFYEVSWDGRDLNGNFCVSGIYFLRIEQEKEVKTGKLILLR